MLSLSAKNEGGCRSPSGGKRTFGGGEKFRPMDWLGVVWLLFSTIFNLNEKQKSYVT